MNVSAALAVLTSKADVCSATAYVRFGSKADICSAAAHVRFGSKADICSAAAHVRFAPNSDINCVFRHVCFGPIADIQRSYSITSSAATNRDCGTVRPSARADWAFTTSSNLSACMTGMSCGLAPLRMRPT